MDIVGNGLDRLDADLAKAGLLAGPRTYGATYRAGTRLRDTARQLAPSSPVVRHYPSSITADTDVEDLEIVTRVGPDKDRVQGPLGNILEYGTATTPPHAHLGPALDRVAPGWVDEITDIAGKLL